MKKAELKQMIYKKVGLYCRLLEKEDDEKHGEIFYYKGCAVKDFGYDFGLIDYDSNIDLANRLWKSLMKSKIYTKN